MLDGLFQMIGQVISSGLQFDSAKKQRKEEQRMRGAADRYNKKSLAELQNLDTYEMGDLYKKLGFGQGEDDLQKFNVGKALSYQMNPDSLYKQLASKDPLVRQSSNENLAALRQLRDTGFTKADRSRLAEINQQQRSETQRQQDAIQQRAIERGANPHTTGIFSKIAADQGAANNARARGLSLDQMGADRQLRALQGIEGNIQSRFARDAAVASAGDRVNAANTGWQNQASQANWARQNSVGDRNTSLQNQLVNRNTSQYLAGRRGVKDSANQKRHSVSSGYQNAANNALGQASQSGARANSLYGNAANAAGQSAGALGSFLNEVPWGSLKKKKMANTNTYTTPARPYHDGGYPGPGGPAY